MDNWIGEKIPSKVTGYERTIEVRVRDGEKYVRIARDDDTYQSIMLSGSGMRELRDQLTIAIGDEGAPMERKAPSTGQSAFV